MHRVPSTFRLVRSMVNPSASKAAGSEPERLFWSTPPVQNTSKAKEPPKAKTTTKELVMAISETHKLSQAESRRVLQTVFDSITEVSFVFRIVVRVVESLFSSQYLFPVHSERQDCFNFWLWNFQVNEIQAVHSTQSGYAGTHSSSCQESHPIRCFRGLQESRGR